MKTFYLKIFNIFAYFYLYIFSRKIFHKFNLILLKLILKSLGYQNFGSHYYTGEKKFIKSIKKFQPKVCIDIGAHAGSYSSLLIEELKCIVISFEANKYTFKKLNKLKKNFGNRFFPFNFAITNKNKKLDLYYGNKFSQLASLSKDLTKINFVGNLNKNKMKVKGITLDSFFSNNKKFKTVDFIKIDAEGHEFEVLLGAKKVIKRFKPKFIQIEFNWHQLYKNNTLLNFHKLLVNYDAYRILPLGRSLIKINTNRPEDNIFHLSNIVFVKKTLNYEK